MGKENKRWFIDYPEWKGDKWELEMVCGADTMLDIIAGHPTHKEVYLSMSLKPFIAKTEPIETLSYPLTKIEDTPDIGGARYFLKEWYGEELNLENETKTEISIYH